MSATHNSRLLVGTHNAQPSLLTALHDEHDILAALLINLDWKDVYNLLTTSSLARTLFTTRASRDVVLARFVPGYDLALRESDERPQQDVPVSLHDLDMFMLSHNLPLHRYPAHALKIINANYPSIEDDARSALLVHCANAHSKFVLLLQSLVHSSSLPFLPEPALDSVEPRLRTPTQHRSRSQNKPLPQLSFPAPLSYPQPVQKSPPSLIPRRLGTQSNSNPFKSISNFSIKSKQSRKIIPPELVSGVRSRTEPDRSSIKSTRGSRLTLFPKSNDVATPSPVAEPHALKMYSRAWLASSNHYALGTTHFSRDSTTITAASVSSRRIASAPNTASSSNNTSDDSLLTRPPRRFSTTHKSSESSLSTSDASPPTSSPPSSSDRALLTRELSSRTYTVTSSYTSPPVSTVLPPVPPPHDLLSASSRTRAPILRVFVPCTQLTDGSNALLACEQQLVDTGLWDYLSTGDVICNLGYVGSEAENGLSKNEDIRGLELGLTSRTEEAEKQGSETSWLLFNGRVLVPYAPGITLPLEDPLALPSPFYYANLPISSGSVDVGVSSSPSIPPSLGKLESSSSNLRLIISRFPPALTTPISELISVERVMHTTKGPAIINRWAWTVTANGMGIVLNRGSFMENELNKQMLNMADGRSRGLSADAETSGKPLTLDLKQRLAATPLEDATTRGALGATRGEILESVAQAHARLGGGWRGEWVLEGDGTAEGRQVLLDAFSGAEMGNREWEAVREKSGDGRIWLRLIPT